MPFLAGDIITAQRLNRSQPKRDYVKCTSIIPVSSTNTDIPGATLTFTVETAGAECLVFWTTDFENQGAGPASGATSNSRVILDSGAAQADASTIFGSNTTGGRASVAQNGQFEGLSVGSHTIKIVGNTVAGTRTNFQTTLTYLLFEVV